MSQIRGIVGVVPHPHVNNSNNEPYFIICSSNITIKIDPSYISSSTLLPLPGKFTKISIFNTLLNNCTGTGIFFD